MRSLNPAFMTPDLTTLPETVYLDFTIPLKSMRDLMVEFHPIFTQREFESAVKKLIEAIALSSDVSYGIAAAATDLIVDCFSQLGRVPEQRLREVEQIIVATGMEMYHYISQLSGYVSGIFPYRCVKVLYNSEVVLRNYAYRNYLIEMEQRPFQFVL